PLGVRRLEDGGPARDLRLYEVAELPGCTLLLPRPRAAEAGRPGLTAGVVQRLVERPRELIDDRLRRPFGGENSGPNTHLIVDAGLLGRPHLGPRHHAPAG